MQPHGGEEVCWGFILLRVGAKLLCGVCEGPDFFDGGSMVRTF